MIDKLQGKPNISVMADRGFSIYDQLKVINVDLNIPPFMEGRGQLPEAEVLEGQKIASLRVHIERVIGRIKYYFERHTTYHSIKDFQSNCICAWLLNFQLILIPPDFVEGTPDDVEQYFDSHYDTESGCNADSESSHDTV